MFLILMAPTAVSVWQLLRVSCCWLLLICMSGCYAAKQVYYQGNLLATRKRVDVLIWRNDTPAPLKLKLKSVKEVLNYAEISGLNVGGAYATYIETPNAAVSYLVQAAEVDQLKLVTWWFPFIGDVPYLGYYHKADRDTEALRLRNNGYDVEEGVAGAFSSLGWYDDPIYSSMLKNDDAELTHLLFHELVHRTFWVADAAEFNENLAEYVAEKMTQAFLNQKGMSKELNDYDSDRADKAMLRKWLRDLRHDLKELYDGPLKGRRNQILVEKAKVFAKYTTTQFPKFNDQGYQRLQKKSWSNATVLAMSVYSPDVPRFEKAYRCSKARNAGEFLVVLNDKVKKSPKDPLNALDSLCN